MISKNSGLSLELHSKSVARIAQFLCEMILSENYLKENLNKIIIAALIHDIGKCSKNFQEFLLKKIKDNEEVEEEKIYLLHQELSWAIAMCILDINKYEHTLNAIYWHHSKPIYDKTKNNNDYISNILSKISDAEIVDIYDNLLILIPNNLITFNEFKLAIDRYKQSSVETPKYYSNITYEQNWTNKNSIIYRSIVISSDRISSKLDTQEVERTLIDDDFCIELIKNNKKILDYTLPSNYDQIRLNLQLQIIDDCNNNKTCIVKAPAGFGKTFIGLLWSAKRENKLLWVCPRNIIVESVYDSILKELKNLKLENKISVELFLTGQRKNCTNDKIDIFQSDIVVTNIDNFLSPISKNRFGIWSVDILKRDVVFDEFHEFICDNALFSGFIEIMNIRHKCTKCNTVLLSATPSLYNFLWDNPSNKTKILPNENTHYPAAHNISYNINFIDETNLVNDKNSLIMTNSIYNAQLKKKELNMELLVHSDFLDDDKEKIFKSLYDNYGKNVISNKLSVSSAPIIQASMDISFLKINISLLSPEQTLQVTGRCNRWGEYNNPSISIFKLKKNLSEYKAIDMLYDKKLNDIWYNFLETEVSNHNNVMILNNLYEIYNKFNILNEKEIKEHIQKKYKLSIESLSKIEPIKYIVEKNENKKTNSINIDIISWRTGNGESIFVTYPYHDIKTNIFTAEYTTAFNVNLQSYGTEKQFKEDDDFRKNIKKVIKKLYVDDKFNYPKSLTTDNGFTIERLKKYAKYRADVPYIAFNKEYSKEYGLAKKDIYD